jgi:hypothetical protein
MNDNEPSPDPNPYWDSVEPECRWVPQCRRMLIPGACDRCESLNPNPDLAWYEDREP